MARPPSPGPTPGPTLGPTLGPSGGPSLGAYLALARLRGARGGRGSVGPSAEADDAARPAGALLWAHADGPGRVAAVAALAERLGREGTEVATLLTLPPELPEPATGPAIGGAAAGAGPLLVRPAPPERPGAVRAFLERWRPDLLLWIGGGLRPALVAGGGAMPRLLVEGAPGPRLLSHGAWVPGLARRVVPLFDRALATDEAAAARLRRAGLPAGRVGLAPPLGAPAPVPPCNERERRDLAGTIGARPVWLAAGLPLSELAPVAAAHARASRSAHRLLLIVAPRAAEDVAAFAQGLAEAGLRVASRADGAEPEDAAQVYLADGPAEMGLWYRLAPVTYLGGTLPGGPGGRPPFEAASLGSALVHGPRTAPHEGPWARLHAVGAARAVRDGAELGRAVEALISPDRAAAMAHAAWDVATEGAEVLGLVADLVTDLVTGLVRERPEAGRAGREG